MIFAGVVLPSADEPELDRFKRVLTERLSRDASDVPRLVRGQRHVLAFLDPGTLGCTVVLNSDSSVVSVAAGRLLLPSAPPGCENGALLSLQEEWSQASGTPLLASCRGAFSCVHIDSGRGRVQLVTDRLGLRPMFHAQVNGRLYFSSTLRVLLELCPALSQEPDLVAQAQLAVLGYTLGTSTPYTNVRVLEPATTVDWWEGEVAERTYFNWRDIEPTRLTKGELCSRLHSIFLEGVRIRLADQSAVVAHLSGGLDSRCVVAGLRELGVEVHSINFAPEGTSDLVLGRMAANALGTKHVEVVEGPFDMAERSLHAYYVWRNSLSASEQPERIQHVWSGYGGDTVLSRTQSDPKLLLALTSGDLQGIVQGYFGYMRAALPVGLFREGWHESIRSGLFRSVQEQILRYTRENLTRGLQTYIAMHELRGPTMNQNEEQDLRRLEAVRPLCDPDVVALALSAPGKWLLKHRLYYEWLQAFPEAVASVPWQAYPTSDPCPLPIPEGLRDQWSDGWFSAAQRRQAARDDLQRYRQMLSDENFPKVLLRRGRLWIAYFLASFGVHRYLYMLKAAWPFVRYGPRT